MRISDTSLENNSKQQNTDFENVKLQMYRCQCHFIDKKVTQRIKIYG